MTLKQLLATLPQTGRVDWIGLRPERRATIEQVQSVDGLIDSGLVGDRYAGRSGNRQVTLIQTEHLTVMASLLGLAVIEPQQLRRNICISGINLLALKDKKFLVGTVVMEYTGLCHPCSYMEELFGDGGYNAVRGHGGITARILRSGTISLADEVSVVVAEG